MRSLSLEPSPTMKCTFKILKPLLNSLEWNEIYLNLTKKLLLNDFYYDGNALAVELLEIDDSSFNKPKSLIPSNILDTPFMHLLFIQCEVSWTYRDDEISL